MFTWTWSRREAKETAAVSKNSNHHRAIFPARTVPLRWIIKTAIADQPNQAASAYDGTTKLYNFTQRLPPSTGILDERIQ